MIDNHPVVTQEEWLAARKQLLAREREFTRMREELAAERRWIDLTPKGRDEAELPYTMAWVKYRDEYER